MLEDYATDTKQDFCYQPSATRFARTDITAFFMQQFLELKVNGEEGRNVAKKFIALNEKNGPGLIVYPN